MSTLKAILDKQAKEYNKHLRNQKRVQTTLDYQYRVQREKTIPKKHRPKPPLIICPTNNQAKITQDFHKKYEQLFYETLQQAITQNMITLELERGRCREALDRVEIVLRERTIPQDQAKDILQKFLKSLNLDESQITARVQRLTLSPKTIKSTESDQATESISKQPAKSTSRKRKNTSTLVSHSTKQLKLDHFLCLGPKSTQDPP